MYNFKHILFRGVEDKDISWLHKMINMPSIASGFEASNVYILPASEEAVRAEYLNTEKRVANFIAEVKAPKPTTVGYVQLYINEVTRVVEPMLFVDPEFQRMGYGRSLVQFATWAAFSLLNGSKFEIAAFSFNEAAIRLYRSEGFFQEGCIRQCSFYLGRMWDKVCYGKTKSEWLASIADQPDTINAHWSLGISGI